MNTTPVSHGAPGPQVEALIHQHLLQERGFLDDGGCLLIEEWPWIDVGEAIGRCATAPEHLIGERPIAMFTLQKNYPECFNAFLLITDRRLVGRWVKLNGSFVDVNLRYGWTGASQITGGMLSKKLVVQYGQQNVELNFGLYNEKLEAFFNALAQIPADQREPAALPLCAPSEGDPTGARGAASHLIATDDARTVFLLDYIARSHEGGLVSPEIGADLVSRLVLQHRNERYGRGVCDGSWMSPLGRDDLSNVLVAIYQNPVRHVEEPDRALTFDVRNKAEKVFDAIDKVDAVLSLDVMGALGPSPTNLFTVLMKDTASFCSFRLFDNNVALRTKAPELVEMIHAALDRLEAATLLRRCAYGWNGNASELLNTPSSDIVERFGAVVGQFDATVLGRPADQRSRKR